jgi:hypothetical protein
MQASRPTALSSAVVLMVVQDPDRNAFDQRILEWHLQER